MDSAYTEEAFDSAEDLLAFLSPFGKSLLWAARSKEARWIFRGVKWSEYSLRPSAVRTVDGKENAELRAFASEAQNSIWAKANDAKRLELEVVRDFCEAACRLGYPIPGAIHEWLDLEGYVELRGATCNFPPRQLRSMFALAQHHGVPTRLLDWTLDPFVACYFASAQLTERERQHSPERLAVWAIASSCIDACARGWGNKGEAGAVIVNAAGDSNPNLLAQKGLFTLVKFDKKTEEQAGGLPDIDRVLLDNMDRIGDEYGRPIVVKLTLPRTQVGRLRRLLRLGGSWAPTVFPGLDGVSRGLVERQQEAD